MENESHKGTSISALVSKGEQIYKELIVDTGREKELVGQYVAIEVDSRGIFLGSTKEEAFNTARDKFPAKLFYVRRVGSPDAVSSRSSSPQRAIA
ncbi:MAG: hypothetical protein HYT40_01885 [Candidatus Sungbacteria bacterium]|uniref:DUF5678 domain-containing protein n=1 Tax=Candidatus Sungiibacteriota bacterium TaxID=2750080 RepID=A0A931SBH8_9BACT|nr:hypothetical protein [Candidatus Sungbacteria bacterium]